MIVGARILGVGFDNNSVQKGLRVWPGDISLLKIKSGSRLQRNVTVKSRRQPQRALSSHFVRDPQNCCEKSPGYIFISLRAHDWNEPTKLWRTENCVTYSTVLSGMLQERVSQLEPDWRDVIKCISTRFKGARQRERTETERKHGADRQACQSVLKRLRILTTARRERWREKVSKLWGWYVRENSMSSSQRVTG